MARVQNPTLFSAYFGVPPKTIVAAGLIDPFLDVDVPLFIDPVLLENRATRRSPRRPSTASGAISRCWCGC